MGVLEQGVAGTKGEAPRTKRCSGVEQLKVKPRLTEVNLPLEEDYQISVVWVGSGDYGNCWMMPLVDEGINYRRSMHLCLAESGRSQNKLLGVSVGTSLGICNFGDWKLWVANCTFTGAKIISFLFKRPRNAAYCSVIVHYLLILHGILGYSYITHKIT